MGVPGLLQLLKGCTHQVHLAQLRGRVIAVDGYVWLHRSVRHCAKELCEGQDTIVYVESFMNMLQSTLLQHGCIPLVVFDGAQLAAKGDTREDRARRRRDALAKQLWAQALEVRSSFARNVMLALQKRGIATIVAPFEADAQLAYLSVHKLVDYVLTEDSDLLVFGAGKVLFKVRDGCGEYIDGKEAMRHLRLRSVDQLQLAVALSGCDYTPKSLINGLGLKRALNVVRHETTLGRALNRLRREGKYKINELVEKHVKQALVSFAKQAVWHVPVTHTNTAVLVKHDKGFIAPLLMPRNPASQQQNEVWRQVQFAQLCPRTKESFDAPTRAMCAFLASSQGGSAQSSQRRSASKLYQAKSTQSQGKSTQSQTQSTQNEAMHEKLAKNESKKADVSQPDEAKQAHEKLRSQLRLPRTRKFRASWTTATARNKLLFLRALPRSDSLSALMSQLDSSRVAVAAMLGNTSARAHIAELARNDGTGSTTSLVPTNLSAFTEVQVSASPQSAISLTQSLTESTVSLPSTQRSAHDPSFAFAQLTQVSQFRQSQAVFDESSQQATVLDRSEFDSTSYKEAKLEEAKENETQQVSPKAAWPLSISQQVSQRSQLSPINENSRPFRRKARDDDDMEVLEVKFSHPSDKFFAALRPSKAANSRTAPLSAFQPPPKRRRIFGHSEVIELD
ncbi:MAG: hypothetical protein MHM6MM_004529 [Cercozoa sp. M6MM]